ncbi:MAG: DUF1501 domain-containing protein [Planctomycetes bacterium]|nr:DUF1501 domain-containing protein [Planctomycetota bacterium]
MVAGSVMMPGIIDAITAGEARGAESRYAPVNPLAPKAPHFPAKAKRVIFLFMPGGVSHVDSFDPKPKLNDMDGKDNYLGSLWKPRKWGKAGIDATDLFPNIAASVDDLCLIRSMHTDHNDHFQSTLGIHTGSVSFARPCIGSWVSYGLGTFNQNLPSFMVIAPHLTYAGTQIFSNSFLPAYHQGTRVIPGPNPVMNLDPRTKVADVEQMELGLSEVFNRQHMGRHPTTDALAARIRSYETAFRMQTEAPEAFDLAGESDATLAMYGLQRGQTTGYGWQALVARRLAERGVRFIELIDVAAHDNWDAHSNMASHGPLAKNIDQPIAALIADLKQRGMLDDTLLVFTTEFGRTPRHDGPKGRSHHNRCFTSWLCGGGVKAGYVHGSSDDMGDAIATDGVHTHDFHATILHLLGLNHEKLTYNYAGRDFRLTDVAGEVVHDLIA